LEFSQYDGFSALSRLSFNFSTLTWKQRLTQAPAQVPFSVNDVDWSIVAELQADSLAKVNLSQAQITGDC
jgi:hypothetical protein